MRRVLYRIHERSTKAGPLIAEHLDSGNDPILNRPIEGSIPLLEAAGELDFPTHE